MAKLKFSVHPLCLFFAVYYACTGKILVFVIYTLSALLHELGHSFVSATKGYRMDKICLMPYGAVVIGQTDGMGCRDEVLIALAGPFLNLLVAIAVIATWWLFPLTYAYTDVIAEANLSLCIVNLLPFNGLDGGRIISALLHNRFGEKTANIINKVTGISGAVIFAALFFVSIRTGINVSYTLFSVFLAVSVFDNKSKSRYVKIYLSLNERSLRRGMPVIKTGIYADIPLKKLFSVIRTDCINEVDVYYDGKIIKRFNQYELSKLIENGDMQLSVKQNIDRLRN